MHGRQGGLDIEVHSTVDTESMESKGGSSAFAFVAGHTHMQHSLLPTVFSPTLCPPDQAFSMNDQLALQTILRMESAQRGWEARTAKFGWEVARCRRRIAETEGTQKVVRLALSKGEGN